MFPKEGIPLDPKVGVGVGSAAVVVVAAPRAPKVLEGAGVEVGPLKLAVPNVGTEDWNGADAVVVTGSVEGVGLPKIGLLDLMLPNTELVLFPKLIFEESLNDVVDPNVGALLTSLTSAPNFGGSVLLAFKKSRVDDGLVTSEFCVVLTDPKLKPVVEDETSIELVELDTDD